MAGCPPDVRGQAERLVAAFQDLLGEHLVGVYLHGSLAMGCFNPARSDLDLLVVADRALSPEEKRRCAELLLAESRQPSPIEISVLTRDDLRPWRHPAPFDFHYSEDWREQVRAALANGGWRRWNDERRYDPDLAAHVTVTRARGVRLAGEPIESAFPDVPPADYLAAILDDFEWARAGSDAQPVYAVLNGCRVLSFVVDGAICSKDEGGRWALGVLSSGSRRTLQRAIDAYRGDADEVIDRADVELVLAEIGRLIADARRPPDDEPSPAP